MGKMRKAMREGSPCVVQLLNYKKNGVRLTNLLCRSSKSNREFLPGESKLCYVCHNFGLSTASKRT